GSRLRSRRMCSCLNLRRYASRLDVMQRRILNRQRAHRRLIFQQWSKRCRDLLKETLVVILNVRGGLPQGYAAKLARSGIKRFQVVNEPALSLDARQKIVIQRRLEFTNFLGIDGAGDNTRDHPQPPVWDVSDFQ